MDGSRVEALEHQRWKHALLHAPASAQGLSQDTVVRAEDTREKRKFHGSWVFAFTKLLVPLLGHEWLPCSQFNASRVHWSGVLVPSSPSSPRASPACGLQSGHGASFATSSVIGWTEVSWFLALLLDSWSFHLSASVGESGQHANADG